MRLLFRVHLRSVVVRQLSRLFNFFLLFVLRPCRLCCWPGGGGVFACIFERIYGEEVAVYMLPRLGFPTIC